MTQLTDAEAQRLAKHCGFSGNSPSIEITTIARLWGGMGHVYRVQHGKKGASMIVKWIDLQQADPSDRGDRRKLDSYTVEVNLYRHYSATLQSNNVSLPTFLYAEHDNNRTILCLSELRSVNHTTNNIHRKVLDWLARFHTTTWQHDSHGNTATLTKNQPPPVVQPRGTYWHLETRPDEWKDMRQHGWVGRLRLAARPIDIFLRRTTSLQSWVHGDCKEANVLQSDDDDSIAMCDFQYVGPGCPLQDVCYFLCSSGVADDETLVDYYYMQLESYLSSKQQLVDRNEFNFLLEVCYCDYMRFMCGWGQWGSDISKRVMAWLDSVDGGQKLESEEAYEQAIKRAFERVTQKR